MSEEATYEKLGEHLRKLPSLESLNDEQIKMLARRAKIVRYSRGEIILRQGDPANEFFVIISGQVRASDTSGESPRLLNYHAEGSLVGEMGLVKGEPRAATVDAVVDTCLGVFDETEFRGLVRQYSGFKKYLEEMVHRRRARSDVDFPGKHPDEVCVLITHKHYMLLVSAIAEASFFFVAVAFLSLMLFWFLNPFTVVFLGGLLGFCLAISLFWIGWSYLDWRNDDYIVTTKRVIHIERMLMYGEERDEAPLDRVRDVTVRIPWLTNRWLDYATLVIKTAGEGDITFTGVPKASGVREMIFDEKHKAGKRRAAADVGHVRRMIVDRMGLDLDVSEGVMEVDRLPGALEQVKGKQISRKLPWFIDYLIPRMQIIDGNTITWRKHWIILLRNVFGPVLTILALIAIFIAVNLDVLQIHPAIETVLLSDAVFAVMGLIASGWFIWQYDDWYRDVYILTDDRIIDVEAAAFGLRETRTEGPFDSVENTNYLIPNFVSKLLNFGDVVIETAGKKETFSFRQVFDPSSIQQEIFYRMVNYKEKERLANEQRQSKQILEWLGEYNYLQERIKEREREQKGRTP